MRTAAFTGVTPIPAGAFGVPERWLPAEPARAEVEGDPWVPGALEEVIDPEALETKWAYVVVDEIVGRRIGLGVSPWPRLDKLGRLRFADPEEDQLVGVSLDGFEALLREHRAVMTAPDAEEPPAGEAEEALRERPVRIGDVFAILSAAVAAWTAEDESSADRVALPDGVPVYDVTYEARIEARLAGAAAVAAPLTEGEANRFLREDGGEGTGPEGDDPKGNGPEGGGEGGSRRPHRPRPPILGPGGRVFSAAQVEDLNAHA